MELRRGERLIPLLERVTHAIAIWIEAETKAEGITQAEAHIIGYLAQVEHCSINDLHRDFGHRRSTLTSILDRLEGRGLLRRMPHPTSRRSVMVELTEQGHSIGARIRRLLIQLDGEIRKGVKSTDLEGFYRVLTAIEEVTRER